MAFKTHFAYICATLRPSWRQLGPLSAICSLKLVKKCPQKAPHRDPGPFKSVVFLKEKVGLQQNTNFRFRFPKIALGKPSGPLDGLSEVPLGLMWTPFGPKLAPSWPKVGPCCPFLAPLGPPKSPPTALRSPLSAPRVAQDAPGTALGEVLGPFLAFSGALFG